VGVDVAHAESRMELIMIITNNNDNFFIFSISPLFCFWV
jgi:hypothetical protein